MPGTFGYRHVIPRLPGFLALHPQLRIQIVVDDRRQDLVRDAVDVTIRLGKLADAGGTVQLLTSVPRVLLNARSYVEQAGAPTVPADLARHRIIGAPAGTTGWRFERDGQVVVMDLKPQITVNDNEGAIVAAMSGMGICSTAMRTTSKEVIVGSMIVILADWKRPAVDVHAYFPQGRVARRAARSLVAYLKAEYEKPTS